MFLLHLSLYILYIHLGILSHCRKKIGLKEWNSGQACTINVKMSKVLVHCAHALLYINSLAPNFDKGIGEISVERRRNYKFHQLLYDRVVYKKKNIFFQPNMLALLHLTQPENSSWLLCTACEHCTLYKLQFVPCDKTAKSRNRFFFLCLVTSKLVSIWATRSGRPREIAAKPSRCHSPLLITCILAACSLVGLPTKRLLIVLSAASTFPFCRRVSWVFVQETAREEVAPDLYRWEGKPGLTHWPIGIEKGRVRNTCAPIRKAFLFD